VQRIPDRRERITQFVSQEREKLVLALIGRAQLPLAFAKGRFGQPPHFGFPMAGNDERRRMCEDRGHVQIARIRLARLAEIIRQRSQHWPFRQRRLVRWRQAEHDDEVHPAVGGHRLDELEPRPDAPRGSADRWALHDSLSHAPFAWGIGAQFAPRHVVTAFASL
jgi:hypothetical protein